MVRLTRRERQLLDAYLGELSPQRRAEMEEALADFDGDYHQLMSHVKRLGGTDADFTAVNRGARRQMKKGRGQVNLADFEEVSTWAEGYKQTKIQMEDLSDPERDAYTGFDLAKRLWGMLGWD